MTLTMILPGMGRGIARSVVEGERRTRCAQPKSPSATGCAGGPPPHAGEELA